MGQPRTALRDATPAHRVRAAERESAAYHAFLLVHDLDDDPNSVILYLTSLLQDPEQTGKGLRRALSRLDLAAALAGRTPPSSLREVRVFLRGAHRSAPLGPPVPRCDPMYQEQARLVIQQALRPTPRQLRDIACLLIVNSTGARYPHIRDLRWNDVRLRKHNVDITLRTPRDESVRFTIDSVADHQISTVHVLRALRLIDGPGDGPVLAQRGDHAGPMRYRRLLVPIGATDPRPHALGVPWAGPRSLQRAVAPHWAPGTAALRDRALLTLAWLAALTNVEAAALRAQDVTVAADGLILSLPFRPTQRVGLPAARDPDFCPVHAWTTWLERYRPQVAAPAFPRMRPMGARISSEPLTETGLSEIVKQHAAAAGLDGAYTFTSLRLGLIRSAIRHDVPAPVIAQHTGLRQLRTIDYERSRELLLTEGAVTRLGL